jgi:hypothetical protein
MGEILGFYKGYTSYVSEHKQKSHVAWHAMKCLGAKEGLTSKYIESEYIYRMVGA